MNDQTERDLNRLTLVGWIVLAGNMLTCIVVVPLVIVNVWPGIFEIGGRTERLAMVAGFLLIGGAGFWVCKWLLEMLGITVLRPPQKESPCRPKHLS